MNIPAIHKKKSRQYRDLEQELRKLRRFMLPKNFSPIGNYSQLIYTKTLAYRILAHAGFESYFEDRVSEVYLTAINNWQNYGKVSKVIPALLAFSGMNMESPPDSIVSSQSSQRPSWDDRLKLSNKVKNAGTSLMFTLKKNHGIREKNLLDMLLRVGIESDDIDAAWLATIDSFGQDRGNAAHISAAVNRTQQPPDPKSELDRVTDLLTGLKEIDEMLNYLMKK